MAAPGVLLESLANSRLYNGDAIFFGSDLTAGAYGSIQRHATTARLDLLTPTYGVRFTDGTSYLDVIPGTGITFNGIVATGISFYNATFVPDTNRTDIALEIGSRANELDVTMAAAATQNFDPVQINLNVIGANPTSTSTLNVIYQQVTHDTTDMANLRLKGADWTMAINKNLQDAYIFQGEIDYGAAATSVSGESGVGCFTLNAGTGAVTGNLRGIIVNVAGAGLPSTTSIGVEVRTDGGSAVLAEGIRIWSVGANSITSGIEFRGSVTEGVCFDQVTYTPDASRTDFAIGIGSRTSELTVNLGNAASQNFEPFQMNINLTASGGAPTSSSTARLLRIRSTHDTIDMPNLTIMNINTYMDVRKNMEAAYGQMNGVDFYTNAVAITTEAAVGAFNMECNSAVTGNVRGIIVNLYGAGLPSTTSIGIEVRSDGGAATLAEGIRIWGVGTCSLTTGLKMQGTITNIFDFTSIVTAVSEDNKAAPDKAGSIAILTPAGAVAYINYYDGTRA